MSENSRKKNLENIAGENFQDLYLEEFRKNNLKHFLKWFTEETPRGQTYGVFDERFAGEFKDQYDEACEKFLEKLSEKRTFWKKKHVDEFLERVRKISWPNF